MFSNYISAAKSSFIILDLNLSLLEHPNVRYFVRSLKINRPLKATKRPVMDLQLLARLVQCCDSIHFDMQFAKLSF